MLDLIRSVDSARVAYNTLNESYFLRDLVSARRAGPLSRTDDHILGVRDGFEVHF
jgi:hypothetical protein